MRQFFVMAPGAIWIAVILFLTLLATWLTTYFALTPWVAPLAGLLVAVIVPVLKVLAEGATTPQAARSLDAPAPPPRSAFMRWLL